MNVLYYYVMNTLCILNDKKHVRMIFPYITIGDITKSNVISKIEFVKSQNRL